MSAMERTTYRRSLGSNAWAFDEPRRDPQHAPYTSGPSVDSSSDDSIPLFLSDFQGQPDPRDAPLAASQRTSILKRVVAGGLVVSAFAILVAVFNSDVTRSDAGRLEPTGGAPNTAGSSGSRIGPSDAGERQCERAAIGNTEPRGYRKRLSHCAAESGPGRTYGE